MASIYEKILDKELANSGYHPFEKKRKMMYDKFVSKILNNDSVLSSLLKKNPWYTKEHLAQKFIRMKLTTDKEEAKELVEDAINRYYPTDVYCSDYQFKQEISLKGEKIYKLSPNSYWTKK